MAIVKGVPDIVIYGVGAFAIYWFFFREEEDTFVQARWRAANERRAYLAKSGSKFGKGGV